MEWIVRQEGRTPEVTPQQVKLCELCGALNHKKNLECHTCGWRGQFHCDETTIGLAWQRLRDQFEEVRMEHVVGRRAVALGDFGAVRQTTGWQRMRDSIQRWWGHVRARRERRGFERNDFAEPQHASDQRDTAA